MATGGRAPCTPTIVVGAHSRAPTRCRTRRVVLGRRAHGCAPLPGRRHPRRPEEGPDPMTSTKTVVIITSPLEAEFAERIAAVEPERVEVIYRPDLMPPTRYQGDHNGPSDWPGFATRREEWHRLLRRAEVLWDFPTHEEKGILELSPNLRWVQTSSAGVGQYVKRLGLQESDLIVTTASGVHGEVLAEFVFAALLYHAKWFAQLQVWQRNHEWVRFCGGELTG